jgi:type 1 glutamine amidotransferase
MKDDQKALGIHRPSMKNLITAATLFLTPAFAFADEPGFVTYSGANGPGKGKNIVLIAGDEEYRSEDCLPMLGKILSQKHGYNCTVLFSINKEGFIDPNAGASLTHPEALDSADAIVMLIRFRKWPDEAMKHFDDAMKRGVPVIGLRTSTHAFQFGGNSTYKSYNSFGKDILGEKWVSHWGKHKVEATRGVIEEANAKDPILNGVSDVFGDSDVYEAAPPADAKILMRGKVLAGMKPTDAPAEYSKKRADGVEQPINDPMMPIAWTRLIPRDGKQQKIFTTTMGAATDLASEDLRRMVINAVYWATDLKVPAKADASYVGAFVPLMYGFNSFTKDVKPSAHALTK